MRDVHELTVFAKLLIPSLPSIQPPLLHPPTMLLKQTTPQRPEKEVTSLRIPESVSVPARGYVPPLTFRHSLPSFSLTPLPTPPQHLRDIPTVVDPFHARPYCPQERTPFLPPFFQPFSNSPPKSANITLILLCRLFAKPKKPVFLTQSLSSHRQEPPCLFPFPPFLSGSLLSPLPPAYPAAS